MGIYDRDYYRREGPSLFGGFDRGRVCTWIIGINIVFYLIQMMTLQPWIPPEYGLDEAQRERLQRNLDPRELAEFPKRSAFTDALDLDVPKVEHGQVWRLITHAFLHSTSSVMHIFWNMLILWMFGRDMEDLYGWKEFLAFYLVSALIGGLAYSAAFLANVYNGPALGASGAVTAVVTLFACHFPGRVILVFMIIPVPIWVFVLVTIAKDSFDVLGKADNGIASAAHVGGAIFAFFYNWRHWHVMNVIGPFLNPVVRFAGMFTGLNTLRRRRNQPRLRVYREVEEERPAPVGVTAMPPLPRERPEDEGLEDKMDEVLEKISRFGKENLTDSDREVLRLAAEAIKRRRS